MNRRTIQLAVLTLGLALLLIVVGAIVLALKDKTLPGFLETAGGACIGALALAIPARGSEAAPPAKPVDVQEVAPEPTPMP